MAFVAPLFTAVTAIAGLVGSKKNKAPEQQPLPAAPTAQNAQADAAEQLQKKRRTSLLQGGNTDLTQGTGVVGASDVGKKSLLGQ